MESEKKGQTVTDAEYTSALDALDEDGFAAFRAAFGGDFTARKQYVDDFVHHPEHERRICQLLLLKTEEEKLTEAALISAKSAADSAKWARWSMIWAALGVAVAICALIIAVYGKGG